MSPNPYSLTPGRQVRHRPGQGRLNGTDSGKGGGIYGAQEQEGDCPVTISGDGKMIVYHV